ncbi:MAG: hypothetical protein FWG65_01815 [Turicibacter sp.]|nr:hypothetical protein [Turicibacter sp.]
MAGLTFKLDGNAHHEAEIALKRLGLSLDEDFDEEVEEERYMTDEEYERYFNPVNLAVLEESYAQAERGEVITFTFEEWEEYTKC